jgi:hypothetical protein
MSKIPLVPAKAGPRAEKKRKSWIPAFAGNERSVIE